MPIVNAMEINSMRRPERRIASRSRSVWAAWAVIQVPNHPPDRPNSDPRTLPSTPLAAPAPAAAFHAPAPVPAPARAALTPADWAASPAMTATVNLRPGRLRRNPPSTSSATCSRNIPRPRESRCLTASSLSSSAPATSATDRSSR